MATSCAYEFQFKHFGFADCKSSRFQTLNWSSSKVIYVLYRLLAFGFQIGWLVAGWTAGTDAYYFKLSNWCMMFGTIYHTLAFLSATHGLLEIDGKKDTALSSGYDNQAMQHSSESIDDELPTKIDKNEKAEIDCESQDYFTIKDNIKWFHKATWIFHTISIDTVLLVTALYWGLVYPYEDPELRDIHGYAKHLFNFGLLFIDMFLNNIPVRYLHAIYTILSSVVYSTFLVILHFTNVESAVYAFTDFDTNPVLASGILASISIVGPWILHAIWFGIYHLRWLMQRSCKLSPDNTSNSNI